MMKPPYTEAPARPIQPVARELCDSSGFLLARLGLSFKAQAIARTEEGGFEVYDYSVLAILAEGDRQTQATMADALAVDPSRLVGLLDSLEERGLVVRQRDPLDRRRHVVSLTADGRLALDRIRELARGVEDAFLAPLDSESRASFHDLLLRLAAYHDPSCAFALSGPAQVEEEPLP